MILVCLLTINRQEFVFLCCAVENLAINQKANQNESLLNYVKKELGHAFVTICLLSYGSPVNLLTGRFPFAQVT